MGRWPKWDSFYWAQQLDVIVKVPLNLYQDVSTDITLKLLNTVQTKR